MIKEEKLTLLNIGDGAAQELFDEQLQKVLKNIADVNTEDKAERTITLKITFKPDEKREFSAVSIQATSKLAPDKAYPCTVMLANGSEGFEAYEVKRHKQTTIFDDSKSENVIGMERKDKQ
ncbi:MAG: hypothetical protein WC900_10400 [Oscillospiraceae bacterium]|jgi:hypothetical protein